MRCWSVEILVDGQSKAGSKAITQDLEWNSPASNGADLVTAKHLQMGTLVLEGATSSHSQDD